MKYKVLIFITVSLWIIITRIYDVYETYLFMPNLDREINPLVKYLHVGWTGLLLVITLLVVYIIFSFYKFLFDKPLSLPKENGLNFSEFFTTWYFGKKENWYKAFYKFPDTKRVHYFAGVFFASAISVAGLCTTLMWVLIKYTSWYYTKYHNIITLLIGFSFCFVPSLWYIQIMYKRYKLLTA
ncbi:MAG: hypothetical protein V5804_06530 [Mucilaginibacter sp.]|uniref:hypothetical protein n=1 Tax=Mucilaginibacter sp. TaxID=1882438 RepID=UPI0034E4ED9B